ncbi:YdeI family protein [Saccharibacillus sp. JS10]|uniref:YdeI/OmpD-associated family protein n=1 Tax=Saccharibacillus sp. JS10 TaxID=2950552 RepID=UPI0021087FB7|nr:DUF1801 domain-containing protein [Saccharibacillus sp. JS10]MCQ4088457.1 YdeI/OmpD-associated family protein [Saccharibacillus sp. JS10]
MESYSKHPKVDTFLEKSKQWNTEFVALRDLALQSGATEDLKWGQPCYTIDGHNVFLIHGFKEYCAILFMKGALMTDPQAALIQQTDKVQAARQLRFKDMNEIEEQSAMIAAYLQEAIQIEKSGQKVELKPVQEYAVPIEFQTRLDQDKELQKAFESLTPGRQRAYLIHFTEPKQSKTREARIDKHTPRILSGLGLNDR